MESRDWSSDVCSSDLNIITSTSPVYRLRLQADDRQKKRAASLMPAALVVDANNFLLHAHPKTAGASKKAEAKKAKEAKVVLVGVHASIYILSRPLCQVRMVKQPINTNIRLKMSVDPNRLQYIFIIKDIVVRLSKVVTFNDLSCRTYYYVILQV